MILKEIIADLDDVMKDLTKNNVHLTSKKSGYDKYFITVATLEFNLLTCLVLIQTLRLLILRDFSKIQ